MSKVWFITGSSKGFGRIWAEAALERGDKVALTARNVDTVGDLAEQYGDETVLPLTLDVTDKAAVTPPSPQAHEHFGRLDVVVNNAGYGLFGAVEEISEQQARDQLETNLFGALWVTQAALPILRDQSSGHVVQVSTIGGVHTFPGLAATTPRSGPWRASPSRWPARSPPSASRSRWSSPAATPPTGPGRPR